MSNIDKIRQEIKRRYNYENEMYHKKKLDGRPNDGWAESLAIMGVLEELLTFIDSLPDEPESNDLEEAAKTFCDTLEGKEAWSYGPSHYDWDDVNNAFIAGAEWQKSQMLKDAVDGRVFMSFAPGHNQMVMADVDLPTNTKVRIVILKEEGE